MEGLSLHDRPEKSILEEGSIVVSSSTVQLEFARKNTLFVSPKVTL